MGQSHNLKTTESYRISQILKRRILKKHMIISNINLLLKIIMLLLVAASLIFFSLVASKVVIGEDVNTYKPNSAMSMNVLVKHAIGLGQMTFSWPVIMTSIVFIGELVLFFFIIEKRKRINASYRNNGYGNIGELNKLTKISLAGYSLSLIFIACMFGSWFHFIDLGYGDYYKIFNPTFPYYIPEFSYFKNIFISISSIMMFIELAVVVSLTIIYFYNNKYKETLEELIPYASQDMARLNSL